MKSIIALPDDYVVLDLETTGTIAQDDDIIEISAIRYRAGVEVARFDQLVAIDYPIPSFVSMLTGITNEMLAGKPHIQDVLPTLVEFIGDDILIGHNIAAFDSCFLAKAYNEHLHRDFETPCVDTLRISKKLIPKLPHHNLETLAAFFSISYDGAHRGIADCQITNACYQKMRSTILESGTIEDFQDRFKKKSTEDRIGSIVPTSNDISPDHPLFGKNIVFTGALLLTRSEAMQLAADCGAILQKGVTTKTDFLVVGVQDIERVGDDCMSSKQEKANRLNLERKANIGIISEDEFLKMVTWKASRNTMKQICFDESTPEEQRAFELLYPHLSHLLFDAPIESGILTFEEQSNYSSVYFLDGKELFFKIRIRKKSRHFAISEEFEDTLPKDTVISRSKSDEGRIRIALQSYEDILKYVDTFCAVLSRLCRRHREIGCCGRYLQCSDAGKCVHPDPKVALSCWYQQNLRDGKIFYGKNRNIT